MLNFKTINNITYPYISYVSRENKYLATSTVENLFKILSTLKLS